MRTLSFLLLFGFAITTPAADLRLDLNRTGSEASVRLSGAPGQEYLIESARGSLEQWTPVTSFILSDPSRLWMDAAADTGNRFFRARTADPQRFADDFRLIDQNGVSRDLYYFDSVETLKAVVLIFAEGNYSSFAPKIAQLRTTPAIANSTLFWTIETGVNNTRSNILKEATAAGIGWPVYHDPMQIVTHDFDAHFSGEAVVISRTTLNVVYRGVIDDGVSNYVAAALTSLNTGAPVITTRMEPTANLITQQARPVADYSTVIAPLLQTKCVVCHSPDNIAPFALTNHQSVVSYAASMKQQVMAGNMPPWHADPEYGQFHNNISLSRTEKAELINWLDAGAPRGTGIDDPLTNIPPPPAEWPAELGPPDQIVTVPVQQVAATGVMAYRYIYANATNTTDKWLKAAFVRPSNKRVVHHYIVWQGHSNFAQLSGIAGYAPGRTERPFPDGTGVLLPANCPLTFNLHYTVDGQAETDQPELALWYADTPPAKPMQTAAVLNYNFTLFKTISIPAGNPDFEVSASQTFTAPTRIYTLAPHMHFRGSRMRFELTVPGVAGKQILLSVPHYNFDWQTIYTLENPIDIPANSTINVVGAFDNSAQNLDNPNPTFDVSWGEQSTDEMFIGYIEYSQ